MVFESLGLNWRDYVTLVPALKRPSDISVSFGHATKAGKALGWKAKVQLSETISRMIDEEMRFQKDSLPVRSGQ
jgi:GDPmannose 4,6-dehydratase